MLCAAPAGASVEFRDNRRQRKLWGMESFEDGGAGWGMGKSCKSIDHLCRCGLAPSLWDSPFSALESTGRFVTLERERSRLGGEDKEISDGEVGGFCEGVQTTVQHHWWDAENRFGWDSYVTMMMEF